MRVLLGSGGTAARQLQALLEFILCTFMSSSSITVSKATSTANEGGMSFSAYGSCKYIKKRKLTLLLIQMLTPPSAWSFQFHFFALSYNSITFCRWPVETHIKIYSMEVCHLNRRCKSIQSFIMSGGLGRTHSPSSDLSTSKLHERRLGGNKLCTKSGSFLRRLAEQKREESPVQLSKRWRQM